MADWKKIKAEYIRGGTSCAKLSKKYNVSISTLEKTCAREKWNEKRKEIRRKTEEKIIENISAKEAKGADIIEDITDTLLNRILAMVSSGAFDSTRCYKDLTGALKDIADLKGRKSKLDAEEQLARIEKLRKDCEEQKAQQIVITMDENLKDFTN